ncbi:MAG TPA: hypothetical protein DCX95_00450, partial [Elusimicrobia bacterium]|nr:hypothetical protein [Elusimicrobiota bacterium]
EFLSIKLIIAPRYPERCSENEKILQKENVSFIRKSQLPTSNFQLPTSNCLLLDTIGELTDAYSIGTVIFVGGSLFEGAGGHNMLEPAELGKTVIFGKFVKNFQESAELLVLQKAAFQVADKEEFFNRAKELLNNLELRDAMGKLAKEVVISRRGATDNNLKIISEILKNA